MLYQGPSTNRVVALMGGDLKENTPRLIEVNPQDVPLNERFNQYADSESIIKQKKVGFVASINIDFCNYN